MTVTSVNDGVRGGAPLTQPPGRAPAVAAAASTGRENLAEARLGPNSVLQTLRALRELEGPEVERRVAAQAGLPAAFAPGLIPERWFEATLVAVRSALPPERAEAVLRLSGRYTADYVARHRIPAPFRGLLRLLPARVGLPLFLAAIRRHAWTFAGSGSYQLSGRYPGVLLFDRALTCRPKTVVGFGGAAGFCGAWYEAAFEGLLRLAAPSIRVREVACQAAGAPRCRFELSLAGAASPLFASPAHGDA